MDKVFIDSDVCLDVYLFRTPFVKASASLLKQVEIKKMTALVSTLSFNNIFYVLQKNEGKAIALNDIKKLRAIVNVAKVDKSHLDKALNSDWNDFEDAMQYYCAVEEGCKTMLTRNTADFKKSELSVYTPAEFLKKI